MVAKSQRSCKVLVFSQIATSPPARHHAKTAFLCRTPAWHVPFPFPFSTNSRGRSRPLRGPRSGPSPRWDQDFGGLAVRISCGDAFTKCPEAPHLRPDPVSDLASRPALPECPAVVPCGRQGLVSGNRCRAVRFPGPPVPAGGNDRGVCRSVMAVWQRQVSWEPSAVAVPVSSPRGICSQPDLVVFGHHPDRKMKFARRIIAHLRDKRAGIPEEAKTTMISVLLRFEIGRQVIVGAAAAERVHEGRWRCRRRNALRLGGNGVRFQALHRRGANGIGRAGLRLPAFRIRQAIRIPGNEAFNGNQPSPADQPPHDLVRRHEISPRAALALAVVDLVRSSRTPAKRSRPARPHRRLRPSASPRRNRP